MAPNFKVSCLLTWYCIFKTAGHHNILLLQSVFAGVVAVEGHGVNVAGWRWNVATDTLGWRGNLLFIHRIRSKINIRVGVLALLLLWRRILLAHLHFCGYVLARFGRGGAGSTTSQIFLKFPRRTCFINNCFSPKINRFFLISGLNCCFLKLFTVFHIIF